MKNYSFSNIAAQESYLTRKSNDPTLQHRHYGLKHAQTNSRIEEIKKKYDTPIRRDRIENLKKSVDICRVPKQLPKDYPKQNQTDFKENSASLKDNHSNYCAPPSFGGNHLKQSFAVNRLQKSVLMKNTNPKELEYLRKNDSSHLQSKDDKENSLYAFKSQYFEDQEIIFSKVREMKESIINNEYMRSSINPRTSISSNNFSVANESKIDFDRQFDPRVENIDKINAKIKQILSCLAQSEKNPSKFLKDNPMAENSRQLRVQSNQSYNTNESYSKGEKSKVSNDSMKQTSFFYKTNRQAEDSLCIPKSDDKNIEKEKIQLSLDQRSTKFAKKQQQQWEKVTYNHEFESSSNNQASSFKKMINRDGKTSKQFRDYSANKIDSYVQNRTCFSKEQQLSKTPTTYVNRHFQTKSALKTPETRGQVDSVKKSTLTDNGKSDLLRSGKKLNDQISKIQKKIQQFEEQKKKLNIQFTPFSMKNRSSTNLVAGARFQTLTPQKIDQRKKTQLKMPETQFLSQNSAKDNKSTTKINREKQESIRKAEKSYDRQESVNFRPNQGTYNPKLDQVDVKTFRIDMPQQTIQKASMSSGYVQSKEVHKSFISSFDGDELRKKADEGIQQRKRRLKNADEIIKTDGLKKLVTLFCQQAKLDQNFRNMKMWLEYDFSKDKFASISKLLSKQGLKVSPTESQSLFSVQQSENNPFFSSQGYNGSYELVVKTYLEAKDHWQTKIKNKFDRSNLTNEGFTFNKIDLQRKGFIELQDLVRLLNIQSGTFFRNRDIFLIFRRFTKAEKINFEEILREICN